MEEYVLALLYIMGNCMAEHMHMVHVGALTDITDNHSRLLAVDRHPGSWDYKI